MTKQLDCYSAHLSLLSTVSSKPALSLMPFSKAAMSAFAKLLCGRRVWRCLGVRARLLENFIQERKFNGSEIAAERHRPFLPAIKEAVKHGTREC
jgi:hypothetical protein